MSRIGFRRRGAPAPNDWTWSAADHMSELHDGDVLSADLEARVDPARFREAMSRAPAAVHIVTTDGPAGPGGITATAVTSISAEPPLVLFCIYRASPTAERMIANNVFCINTLASPDEALADVFAGRTHQHLEERFANGTWTKLETGSPVLASAAAVFDCRIVEVKPAATHYIVIGAVEAVSFGPEQESLVYLHRKYRTL
ncbi:flavin reductase family protein [Methylocapsa palsarum]|uniref:Flavin reductase n=1 Tax=Methylocapsa palsarum TaxID=1612308 RepID=A0A1I3XFE4_9HYPH|nr:flavin reductase family protein [Methylocapsa palsarum]SFK18248.1 flavin reductase [Methylocapsa palsarum]